jgi:hypothetical protein
MPYIYKITNTKNGKVYIGKTLASVEARWNEHCKDCKRQRCEKRPLYSAMNKYGVESFTVETLEECKDDILSEREQYWIELYGSFKYGYNATRGGDGKIYVDYDMVAATYIHIGNIIGTAERLGLDVGTVRRAINARGCKPLSSQQLSKIKNGQIIDMYSLSGDYIKTFNSAHDAARYVLPDVDSKKLHGASGHISDVCKGKRKQAYGYCWGFSDIF